MPETLDSLFGLPCTALKRIIKGAFYFQNKQKVTFNRDFYAGVYPVTQELYEKVMGTNLSDFKGKYHPAEMVSWDDAQIFLEKLNERLQGQYKDDLAFRLPTEVMWEYCARNSAWEIEGKTDLKRNEYGDFSGSHVLDEVGWYNENSSQQTQPVGLKEPNLRGLYDMSGNVWEWCQDLYADDIRPDYGNGFEENEIIKYKKSCVIRGGCWVNSVNGTRFLNRIRGNPVDRNYYLGFRLFRY